MPSLPPGDWAAVEGLVRQAVDCRECFDRGEVAAPFITVAQPRWIPPAYAKQPLRVTVLMINPGESGDTPGARLFLERMTEYRAGRMDLRTLLDFQRETMMRWGNPPGRFARFYFEQLGLSVDQVAFVNVAWCGTKGNTYPGSVLERCFRRHTLPLLRLLAPHVVIASGSSTHRYANALVHELPGIAVEKTLHYAHRSGATVEAEEVARLKAVLAAKRQD